MAAGMSVSRNRVSGAGIRLSAAIAADYFALLKPRVMALSVFTAFVGLVMAPGVINPVVVIVAMSGDQVASSREEDGYDVPETTVPPVVSTWRLTSRTIERTS